MLSKPEWVIKQLTMRYLGHGHDTLQAIDLQLASAEIVGLVGESGSGKSTLGRILAQLQRPTAGEMYFQEHGLHTFWRKNRWGHWEWQPMPRNLRAQIQLMFQDPSTSLNPRMTIQDLLLEPMQLWGRLPQPHRPLWLAERLQEVGLESAVLRAYPHMLSGGQKQRIALARALALRPQWLIADEPISALDVSVQSQILNLLRTFQRSMGLGMLFISHDLAAVRHLCQRAVVLYRGTIVEIMGTDAMPQGAKHPYTRSLLAAQGVVQVGQPDLGQPALSAKQRMESTQGCVYLSRCPWASASCLQPPKLKQIGQGGDQKIDGQQATHQVACHLIT